MRDVLAITKALADESRLRILAVLAAGERCLCQVIPVLGLAPSTVSKHLSVLQQAGLVACRKEGRWRYYRLACCGAGPAAQAGAWVLQALQRDPAVKADRAKLKTVCRQSKEDLCACYAP